MCIRDRSASGEPEVILGYCRRLKFLKEELLSVTDNAGTVSYMDMKTGRTYREKPVVFSYGGVKLLRVGETFHVIQARKGLNYLWPLGQG